MFCPACEEDITSPQPDGICLTCGEELILQTSNNSASSSSRQQSSTQNDAAAQNAMQLLASSMENQTPINPTGTSGVQNPLRAVDRAENNYTHIVPAASADQGNGYCPGTQEP